MSFATRCTACGTIFRVVQDQLKVSDGWVRCGRCDAVFDAASGLFDLEHEAPPAWQPAAPPEAVDTQPMMPTPADAGPFQSEDERRWSESMAAQGLTAEPEREAVGGADSALPPASPGMAPLIAEPQAGSAAGLEPDTEDVRAAQSKFHAEDEDDDTIVITDHPSSLRATVGPVDPPIEARAGPEDRPLVAEPSPGFLRESRRDRPRQSGRATAGLAALAVLLLVALALQAAQQYSELAAARWPASRPVLTAWCGLSHCSVGPPHRIDDIVVESTGLSPVPVAPDASASASTAAAAAAPSALRLAVTLRNRAAYAVALPAVDLSLTDNSGKLIARRTLLPADFQAVAAAAVPAATDLPLQTLFKTDAGAARVSGYTVEIFYP